MGPLHIHESDSPHMHGRTVARRRRNEISQFLSVGLEVPVVPFLADAPEILPIRSSSASLTRI